MGTGVKLVVDRYVACVGPWVGYIPNTLASKISPGELRVKVEKIPMRTR